MKAKIASITFRTLEGEEKVVDISSSGEKTIEETEFKKVSNYYLLAGALLGGGLEKAKTFDETIKVDVITFEVLDYDGDLCLYHVHIDDNKVINYKEWIAYNVDEHRREKKNSENEVFTKEARIYLEMAGALLVSGIKGVEMITEHNYFTVN